MFVYLYSSACFFFPTEVQSPLTSYDPCLIPKADSKGFQGNSTKVQSNSIRTNNQLEMSRTNKNQKNLPSTSSSTSNFNSNRGSKMKCKSSQQKIDAKARLEKSRQSARECRARKKLRYQYLEELMSKRELAVFALRKELQLNLEALAKLGSGQITIEQLEKQLNCHHKPG